MRIHRLALGLAAVALLAPVGRAAAQAAHRSARLIVNPYLGVFVFDDGGVKDVGREANVGAVVGGRVSVAVGERWVLDGTYGYSNVTLENSDFLAYPDVPEKADLDVHMLYGSVGYLISSDVAPTKLLLSIGAGRIWTGEPGTTRASDPLLSVGAGFTQPVNDWVTFRGEARDDVQFCSAVPAGSSTFTACPGGDQKLNHIQVSGGLQFRLW